MDNYGAEGSRLSWTLLFVVGIIVCVLRAWGFV